MLRLRAAVPGICSLIAATGFLAAQPVVPDAGVVNAASFKAPGVPGSAVAQGSIFTIFGQNLGPSTGVGASGFPLADELSDVKIAVASGSTTVNAIPVYVRADQVNAIMPSNAPLGQAQLTVTYKGQAAARPAKIQIVSSSFGIFTATGSGVGQAAALVFNSQANQPQNTPAVTVKPGQFLTIWGTGLGPISGADNMPPKDVGASPKDLRDKVTVQAWVGGKAVTNIYYAGRSSDFAGLDQVIIQVPNDAPAGCFVPAILQVGGVPSNAATLAIDANGSACSDPQNPLSQGLVNGGKIASVLLARASGSIQLISALPPTNFTVDIGGASFSQQAANPFNFAPLLSLPPLGTCAQVPFFTLNLLDAIGGKFPPLTPGTLLNAGTPLTVKRSSDGTAVSIPFQDGGYTAQLGGGIPLAGQPLPLFLNPGTYTVSGPGGPDVGTFSADVMLPAGVTWSNKDQFDTVDRSAGVTFAWSGGDPLQVISLGGVSVNTTTNALGGFYCLVPQSAGSFTVPAPYLAAMPPTLDSHGVSTGFLSFFLVASIPVANLTQFNAAGIDKGYILPVSAYGRTSTVK